MGIKNPFALIFVLVSILGLCSAELEAILAQSRLPSLQSSTRSVYDGDDTIYIFCGRSRGSENLIQKFEITSDTISVIAELPTQSRNSGGISQDSKGNIFYFGGINGRPQTNTVFKFSPIDLTVSLIANLTDNFDSAPVVVHSSNPDIVNLLGGNLPLLDKSTARPEQIRCFNMTDGTECGMYEYPEVPEFRESTAIVYDGKAFVFGSFNGIHTAGQIVVVNLTSLEAQPVNTTLPEFNYEPSAVTDGRYAYITGGLRNGPASVIKFDPISYSHEIFPLKNHPGQRFAYTDTVYVEKLNRIYIFGGTSFNHDHDEIWYVDLTPTEATTASPTTTEDPDLFCVDKPNGIYPHPSECSMFIGCDDGEAEYFKCPEPLLFDPDLLACRLPEEVNCGV